MCVVTEDTAVGENTQRKPVMGKKKPTVGNPGDFDFQKSEDDKKKKKNNLQQLRKKNLQQLKKKKRLI